MYGGNKSDTSFAELVQGLSPRVRGKRRPGARDTYTERSIPACTGETPVSVVIVALPAVYPRVYGGNPFSGVSRITAQGLSPRVRGKRGNRDQARQNRRSIPACTGETPVLPDCPAAGKVYPRVYGGNRPSRRRNPTRIGLSPRVRGKPQLRRPHGLDKRSIPACTGETQGDHLVLVHVRGLSPRVRGKPVQRIAHMDVTRSIPACTGETTTISVPPHPAKVYPRVYGGNPETSEQEVVQDGLSPRVRGKLLQKILYFFHIRSIPACTGETNVGPGAWHELAGTGSIPACTGETNEALRAPWRSVVYPRVYGGNQNCQVDPGKPGGLSPRVRGKQIFSSLAA